MYRYSTEVSRRDPEGTAAGAGFGACVDLGKFMRPVNDPIGAIPRLDDYAFWGNAKWRNRS
jgi:hypothetical protein